ncbi:hypothetical protein [Helicobacter pylori]|nr:hypothetical protein [Helicobacter pylori]
MVYFKVESAFFRVVAFKSFKACLLQDFITPHSCNMGQIQIRSMP